MNSLAVDGSHIFYITGSFIREAGLCGSNPTHLVNISGIGGLAIGLAVDSGSGRIFISTTQTGANAGIWETDLNGSTPVQGIGPAQVPSITGIRGIAVGP